MVLMKYILNNFISIGKRTFLLLLLCISSTNAAPLSDELVQLHSVNTVEMNGTVSPVEGSLIFNTDDKEVYERNATAWHRIASDGSETKMVTGNCINITGVGTSVSPYVVAYDPPPPKNCKEILDAGLSTGDGNYMIDADGCSAELPFKVYCDMTNDGGGWTLVFRHDIAGGYFADDAEADAVNETSITPRSETKYSILNKIDSIKSASAYEFRLYYPNENKRNHWKQTFNPRSGRSYSRPVTGYSAIAIDSSINYWGGLEKDFSGNTFLDGSVNHSNWWYSIGSNAVYNGGIPGHKVVSIVELFIR